MVSIWKEQRRDESTTRFNMKENPSYKRLCAQSSSESVIRALPDVLKDARGHDVENKEMRQ